ncbi:MAG: hypothetical protein JWL61_52 [Gemmatimonadetes bacterium]|nr:hypothetical protein [Gemmatimonadota bacterium]
MVVIAAAVAVAACAGITSAPRDVSVGQSVELSIGETANVTPGSVRVQLTGINDSRCPSDVVCVQAGDAMIILALSGAGADRVDTLSLVKPPKSVNYGGYRFEALDVQPYPKSSGQQPSKTLVLKVNGPQ